MTNKGRCCSCFSCFSGRNTPTPSAPAGDDANAASPTVVAETVATGHYSQTPPSTSRSDSQLKSVGPSVSSSSAAEDQNASSSAVVVKQDEVVPPPPSADVCSVSSPPPCGASSSSTVPEIATSSYSSCIPTDIHHSQQSVASSATQPREGHSSSLQGMPSSSSPAAPEGDSVDVDLEGLIEKIEQRLQLIEENKKSSQTKGAQPDWPIGSKLLYKLREFLSEGINVAKDVIPGDVINTTVKGLLQGMGSAHLVTSGLLVVAGVVERIEEVGANKAECLRLLKEMFFLAKVANHFNQRSRYEGMVEVIKEAIKTIVEGHIMCCSQIDSSKFSKFFKASVNKGDLDNFRRELDRMKWQILTQMGICILDPKKAPLSRIYPKDAVGVKQSVNEIIDLLEWDSENNAIAVMLHGFGGIGKTTLANAVFSRLDIQECKYSTVQLFQNIGSTPDIIKLQTLILKDLMEPEKTVPDIRTPEHGREELRQVLKEVRAFICIDNVLGIDELGQLLPQNMSEAKKVRLLLTARQRDVRGALAVKTKVYTMKDLSHTKAMRLLEKEIHVQADDKGKQIDSTQLNKIVELYGGIPNLLQVVGRFIRAESDKQKAYRVLMNEKKKWATEFGKIESYLFVYNYLPEALKDPFLDICSFFKGWDWDSVADIVGEFELDQLEIRALVSRGTNGVVVVHDVILSIGLQKTEKMRFTFTSGKEIEELLNEKEIPEIKGIWLSENNKDLLEISASKLDLMYSSLRVLALGNFTKVRGRCNQTFKELIFLQAAIPYLPFDVSRSKKLKYLKYEPKNLNFHEIPSSLRHMEFEGKSHSHAFEISSADFQHLENLRILKLTHFYQLKKLPEDLSDLVNGLQELTVSYCTSIEELPKSISKLQSLRVFRMQGCKNVEALPNDFEKLTALEVLDLSFCERLLDLPHGLGNFTSLAELDLKQCSQLRSIPESIGQTKWLASSMDMSGCSSLKELPNGFCNLSFITSLSLAKCSNLEKLPDSFGELVNLRELDLEKCMSLKKLPEGFGQLKRLKEVYLIECYSLEDLCNDFHWLDSLETLSLSDCHSLKRLPEDIHRLASL